MGTCLIKFFSSLKFFTGTKFGAMLDQLTDRCGTMGLLVTLSYFYPRYMFWFQISMVIDIACHWIYLQALVFKFIHEIDMNPSIILSQSNRNLFFWFRSTMQGKTSHKFFDPNENFIMRLYYQKDVLTFMCFCNEMFYSGLYLLHFTTGPTCKPILISFLLEFHYYCGN